MKNLIFAIAFLLLISACSKTKKEYWENGNIKSELSYNNKKLDGLATWYYENGVKQMECTYAEDIINGTMNRWYQNGNKESELLYANNKLNGLSKTWYSSGKLQSKQNYKNDTLDGMSEEWHENGQLKIKGLYKKGKFDGDWLYYDKNGFKVGEGSFINGTGIQKGFFRDGSLKRIIPYKNNLKDGTEIWYNDKGKPIKEMLFKQDVLISQKDIE